jgi:hypothetical protein
MCLMLANMITALLIERFFSNLGAPVNHSDCFCGSSAKMSPQNCSAILTALRVGSSPRRRRWDERKGDEGESERITSTACGSIDVRGARERGQGGEAFGDLGAPDETVKAKDERARLLGEWFTANRGKSAWNKTGLEKLKQVITLPRGHDQAAPHRWPLASSKSEKS